jgi:hypothetical protein
MQAQSMITAPAVTAIAPMAGLALTALVRSSHFNSVLRAPGLLLPTKLVLLQQRSSLQPVVHSSA